MGEASDDVLDGLRCQECADFMPDMDAPGYPRSCPDCQRPQAPQRQRKAKRKKAA